ncbi:MAG TPA: nitrophenyl compound nitroreductase subunit ArsF family protein [Methanospirillum sp.]|uniref:nitrophenyl compound nitroreductase subunit ArsF family protein n=1 Tax=Methanospirillum sp. TaxID=45200 RepID=UPI002BA7EB59|nr:nitrophenyl compound nitroreductase subunit ArsF family protein [Methanospirillum sp.]HOJ95861.1 nitrophenyl compound nitroreductase subunit ArsF family protein [Methanospirillum sp.]HOL40455.1 nitrophenyl compound nitroreductase subunit ArsF family protein [Methanospirillum sp.]HPP79053.1 nitrophenyl compound nitroreductase subunit ArsF family protein [Methanospirillum sp.]
MKNYIPFIILAILTGIYIFSGGCGCNQPFSLEKNATQKNISSEFIPSAGSVEVYHFHETDQCYSCRVIGEMSEDLMNTSFRQEIDDGKIIFRHVNVDLPENSDIVSRFGPTSSSVMIGYSDETGFHAENLIQLWYKLDDKKAFSDELSGTIRKKLEIIDPSLNIGQHSPLPTDQPYE